MPKYIFVCGCGHTGSTILARVLGAHSKIFFVQEESGCFLANRFLSKEQTLRDFEVNCEQHNKEFVLEKTPRHIWHVDYIRRSLPGSKFIYTTRSAKNVIASLYLRDKNLDSALTRYLDDSIMTVRQLNMADGFLAQNEKFITDTDNFLKSVCDWVGIDVEKSMLEYFKNPIEWNKNQFKDATPSQHDLLRIEQVNKPVFKEPSQPINKLDPEIRQKIMGFVKTDERVRLISRLLDYDDE